MIGDKTVNTRGLQTGDKNVPMPMLLARRLTGWAFGDIPAIRRLLGSLRYVGKARGQGIGRITAIRVERCGADYSCVKDGLASRHLPQPGAWRQCRPRPPYWSNVGRVAVCEVWDPAPAWILPPPPEIDMFEAIGEDGDLA